MAQSYSSTTQTYLDIHDITNDLVIMKNGTTSLVLSVDAMNFGLLAEEEQDSIIYAYAGLLNSLNYPIQVIVRSQTKDVTSYLQKLKDQEDRAADRLNQTRIRRYREFVSNLIHERNVLDKKFYVVIPAAPLELGLLPVQSVIPGQKEFDVSTVERSVLLEKAKNILEPKRDHLITQFARIGLYSYQLTTQEIIQLFYISYNPEAAEGQQIADSNSYNTPLVKASFEGAPMFSQQPNSQAAQPQATQPVTTQADADAATPAPAQNPNIPGSEPVNVPPAVGSAQAPVGTTTPPAATPTPAGQPAPAQAPTETEVPVETGSITTPVAEPAASAQAPTAQPTATPIPAGQPAPVDTAAAPETPTAPTTDEVAQLQDEINKTVGQISSVDQATTAAPANSQSTETPENLPEI